MDFDKPLAPEEELNPTEENTNVEDNEGEPTLSAGKKKVEEYVERVLSNKKDEDSVLEGLPESFRDGIKSRLLEESKKDKKNIPPQYEGLSSEILEDIWIIPIYSDPKKTIEERARKEEAIAALIKEEELSEQKKGQEEADEKELKRLMEELGIKNPHNIKNQTTETSLSEFKIEERKKLSGWFASYELAKITKEQGVNLSTLSREEYANFAIKNSLTIDDSQLRAAPWQRMCESPEEIIAISKEKRALVEEETNEAFDKFYFEIKERINKNDLFIQDRIRIRRGTENSNSWLFFKINEGKVEGSKETFKSYVSVKDLNKLTPEKFTSLMVALRDAGYNGDTKIFQDLKMQGISLNDQIVMHGASKNDADLALSVAEKFFGDNLDQKSTGKDEVINGKSLSYSQILAEKIKNAINPSN